MITLAGCGMAAAAGACLGLGIFGFKPRADYYEKHGWPEHEWECNDQEIEDFIKVTALFLGAITCFISAFFV